MNLEQDTMLQIEDLKAAKARQIGRNRGKKWWPWADKVAGQRKVDALSARIFDLTNMLSSIRKGRSL